MTPEYFASELSDDNLPRLLYQTASAEICSVSWSITIFLQRCAKLFVARKSPSRVHRGGERCPMNFNESMILVVSAASSCNIHFRDCVTEPVEIIALRSL